MKVRIVQFLVYKNQDVLLMNITYMYISLYLVKFLLMEYTNTCSRKLIILFVVYVQFQTYNFVFAILCTFILFYETLGKDWIKSFIYQRFFLCIS